jgi:enterochelin esterase-like enzyme
MMLTIVLAAMLCLAVTAAPPAKGVVQRVKVHGKSLVGNLEGDSPDRDVSIYLPPSYQTAGGRRYPVVYMLHGFTDDDERWMGFRQHWINLAAVIDKTLAGGATREMIVVMPNAYTRFQGSMYSTSVTTGDWEGFIANDLVTYIDGHYRTIAAPAARGLAGHSMGGYGTLRIGMRHPEVFSAIYALSPCCLTPPGRPNPRAEAVRAYEEIDKADFGTKAALASAAAWSPNPTKPPLFLDLASRDGELQPAIVAKWAANSPLVTVDQWVPNLRKLRAVAFDAGAQDAGIAASIEKLDQVLKDYQLAHDFEIYEGNHTNRIAERIETKVLPFFSKHLAGGGEPLNAAPE